MMMKRWMPFLVCLFVFNQVRSWEPSWNTLRITWGIQIWKSNVFGKMPLTSTDAENSGYVKVNASSPCQGKFVGVRYYKPTDPGLVVMYDVSGYIAGVQANYFKRLMTDNRTLSWFKQSKMFVEDVVGPEETFTLTGYLVDPAIICTTGRTEEEFEASPSGTGLSVQNGSQPLTNLIQIPLNQDDLANTSWTRGKCFPTMGVHYWYNLTLDMDCNNFKPIFLLYNHNKLTGFGWAGIGNFQNSNRFEHPPKRAFSRFLDPVPNCLNELFDEIGGFTTMHVYMNAYPWNLVCV